MFRKPNDFPTFFSRKQNCNICATDADLAQLCSRRRLLCVPAVIIGGDFNTNRDEALFVSEKTLDALRAAGFKDAFSDTLALKDRVTHPARGKYPDTTFDYLFLKGVEPVANPKVVPVSISDHRPVTCDIKVLAVSSSPKLVP